MIPETVAIMTVGIALAGLMIHFTTTMNRRFDDVDRRFDDVNRRFDDTARQNDAAHAQLNANISALRADFRVLITRPAVEPDQTARPDHAARNMPMSTAVKPWRTGTRPSPCCSGTRRAIPPSSTRRR